MGQVGTTLLPKEERHMDMFSICQRQLVSMKSLAAGGKMQDFSEAASGKCPLRCSGMYYPKDGYNKLRLAGCLNGWYPIIWHKLRVPRCSFICWLALHQRLLTGDRLKNFGSTGEETYVVCHLENESHDHLFFQEL